MKLEKQKAFLIQVAYYALILGFAFVGLKYVFPLLSPFIIGFLVAFVLKPIINWINGKFQIKRPLVSVMVLLIFYTLLGCIFSLFGAKIFSFLESVFYKLPDLYTNMIQPAANHFLTNLISRFPQASNNWDQILNSVNTSISSFVTSASKTVVGAITGFAGQVPSFLLRSLITIVSSFFFTIDYYKIVTFILRQFSKEKRDNILKVKTQGVATIVKFLKAYATLIVITFVELSIGFSILKVPNAFLVAALVAFIDILPVLGTGSVLIPWSCIALLFGKNVFAIGMLVLYLIITVVRQSLEPKIVGQQIGLHPVITLICMFVGLRYFGILGLFLFPITATIVKQLNDEGAIHLFK